MTLQIARKRVLVVAYNFPPVGGAGVQRVTKFVKYLPEFGWDATVLTTENPSVPVYDESLLADIPPQTVIVKARTLEPGYALKRIVSASSVEPSKRPRSVSECKGPVTANLKAFAKQSLRGIANSLLQPDPQVLWNAQAIEAGLRILGQRKHDAIFVTAPPFSSFLIGAELSRRTGLPLVLDYRDEWSISNSYLENKRLGWLSRTWQQHQQSLCVRAASALIATTQHSAESLQQVAQASESHPMVTHIYNGFDATDFCDGKPPLPDATLESTNESNRSYKLAYFGTLWNLTSVEPVVRAVRQLSERSPDLASRLELHFAGRRTAAQDEWLDQLGPLPCRVVRQPYLDHDEALRLMNSADGLCLLLSDLPEAGRVVPAKMFEYLAVRRPIFAIVPPGEVSSLLHDCPFAFVHSPRDVDGLTQRLGDEIERHRLGVSLPTGLWDSSRFERRRQAGQLAELLERVSAVGQPFQADSEERRGCDLTKNFSTRVSVESLTNYSN